MKTNFKYIAICFIAAFLDSSAKAKNYHQAAIMRTDTMLNTPAPDFILKDLNGRTVSLSDYQGKILVIDFWATWCRPCRMSFPSTQLLIDKYKNDPNIQFLFIDTREKTDDYVDKIRQLLGQNHYTFNVVLDEKGTDGTQGKIYRQFETHGIPTKFIIDPKGIIRYKILGFDEDRPTETHITELSELIDNTARLR